MALGPERLEAIFSLLYNGAYNRNEDKRMKKLIKKAFIALVVLGVAGIVCLAGVNTYMIKSTEKREWTASLSWERVSIRMETPATCWRTVFFAGSSCMTQALLRSC